MLSAITSLITTLPSGGLPPWSFTTASQEIVESRNSSRATS